MTYTITSPIEDYDGPSTFSDVLLQFKEGVATTDAELAPGLLAYLERRGYTITSDTDEYEDLLGVGGGGNGDGSDQANGQTPANPDGPQAPPAPPQEQTTVSPRNHAEADEIAKSRGLELTEEWSKLTVKEKTTALNAAVANPEVQS